MSTQSTAATASLDEIVTKLRAIHREPKQDTCEPEVASAEEQREKLRAAFLRVTPWAQRYAVEHASAPAPREGSRPRERRPSTGRSSRLSSSSGSDSDSDSEPEPPAITQAHFRVPAARGAVSGTRLIVEVPFEGEPRLVFDCLDEREEQRLRFWLVETAAPLKAAHLALDWLLAELDAEAEAEAEGAA